MNHQQFITELSKLRPSSTFLSVIGYRNEFSEIANFSIVFHMSYKNALQRSIKALEKFEPFSDYEKRAKQELLVSYATSIRKINTTLIEEIDDAYTRFFDEHGNYIRGLKMHTDTQTLHLYGLLNHKRVLMPGYYPPDNRSTYTATKDKLRSLCEVSKFRQFRILPDQVDKITVEKLALLPPQE